MGRGVNLKTPQVNGTLVVYDVDTLRSLFIYYPYRFAVVGEAAPTVSVFVGE